MPSLLNNQTKKLLEEIGAAFADCVTMDQILDLSIMSSSSVDIAGATYAIHLSQQSGDRKQLPEKEHVKKDEHTSRPEMKRVRDAGAARLAPEFDNLNGFESIVPFLVACQR